MQFWDYTTVFNSVLKSPGMRRVMEADHPGKKLTPQLFYADQVDFFAQRGLKGESEQGFMEWLWITNNRPYYNIYPSILPILTRLRLTLDAGLIKVPMPVLNIRLPKGNPIAFDFDGKHYEMRTLMLSGAGMEVILGGKAGIQANTDKLKGVSIWMDFGEEEARSAGVPVLSYENLPCTSGRTLEEEIEGTPRHRSAGLGVQLPQEIINDCVRLCCTLCLLESDPAIIEPDVLNDDREKWEKTGDPKFVERAKKRGKFGWNVGAKLQVIPHYRSASPAALYWTGPGRAIPKIRFRRATIVHREQVEKLPEGHLGPLPED
jgi:hypothetical protein